MKTFLCLLLIMFGMSTYSSCTPEEYIVEQEMQLQTDPPPSQEEEEDPHSQS